jgi:hypothetical protein
MGKLMKTIGNTCTICTAAGLAALGAVTLATLLWVVLI